MTDHYTEEARALVCDCTYYVRKLADHWPDCAARNYGVVTRVAARLRVLSDALVRLRDCDWVCTPADRMDGVRDIARAALARKEGQDG